MLCSTSFFFVCGRPCIVYSISFWRSASCLVATCMSSHWWGYWYIHWCAYDCTFMLMSGLSLSLFSVQLFWDNQSTMYRSGPGLHKIQTLYVLNVSVMQCKCWDKVATYFLIIATNGLWSVMKQNSNVGNSLAHVVFQGLLILYCCSATQHSVAFCWWKQLGAELHFLVLHHAHKFMPYLTCRNPPPRLTPDVCFQL